MRDDTQPDTAEATAERGGGSGELVRQVRALRAQRRVLNRDLKPLETALRAELERYGSLTAGGVRAVLRETYNAPTLDVAALAEADPDRVVALARAGALRADAAAIGKLQEGGVRAAMAPALADYTQPGTLRSQQIDFEEVTP